MIFFCKQPSSFLPCILIMIYDFFIIYHNADLIMLPNLFIDFALQIALALKLSSITRKSTTDPIPVCCKV